MKRHFLGLEHKQTQHVVVLVELTHNDHKGFGGDGLARDFARSFYHSGAWKRTRAAYMRMPVRTAWGIVPPGMCERCFSLGRLRPADTIHHKVHLSPDNIGDPKVTLSFDNLMRVCRDCHAAIHAGTDGLPESRVTFGPDGEVLQRG